MILYLIFSSLTALFLMLSALDYLGTVPPELRKPRNKYLAYWQLVISTALLISCLPIVFL